uniref:Uncharacterized protein n=1 Tax=Rhizophora mucronata TaxID=61149 RepID=A0A2P2L257_RHIMU
MSKNQCLEKLISKKQKSLKFDC